MSITPPSDLRLEADASTRFLPWALGAMVFLATLALAGALALGSVVETWRQNVSSRLTVQIAAQGATPLAQRLAAAEATLVQTPGVKTVRVLEREAVAAMLKPWLGDTAHGDALPLPGVIDVELDRGQAISVEALAARLEQSVPGAKLDDPKPWLERLVRLARVLQALGAGTVLIVGMAAIALVVFATRASLATRQGTIEVLHLIGAEDAYVARQFQRHISRLALAGGAIGWGLAIVMLLLLRLLAANVGQGLLPDFTFAWWHLPLLVILPVTGWLLAVLTTRLTVLGELQRMV